MAVLDAISDFLSTYLRGGWTALVDIVLVAIIIYWVFILIRGTRAVRIVIGLSILYLVYLVAAAAHLQLLSTLLQTGAVVGLFAIVVVFQPELRRALEQIGRFGSVNRFFVSSDVSQAERVAARDEPRGAAAGRLAPRGAHRRRARDRACTTSPRTPACRCTPTCAPSCWPRSSTTAPRCTTGR